MNFRILEPADVDALHRLDHICFPPNIAFSRDLFEECVSAEGCECEGVEMDGKIVAFSVLFHSWPKAAQIITIDVHPEHRGKGIANELMARMEKSARERGIIRLILQVAIDNEPARTLYEKWGYQVRSKLPDYYGPGKHAFLMDKLLAEG